MHSLWIMMCADCSPVVQITFWQLQLDRHRLKMSKVAERWAALFFRVFIQFSHRSVYRAFLAAWNQELSWPWRVIGPGQCLELAAQLTIPDSRWSTKKTKQTNCDLLFRLMKENDARSNNVPALILDLCVFRTHTWSVFFLQFTGLHRAVCWIRPLPHTSRPLQPLDYRRRHALGAGSQVCAWEA